MIGLSRFGEYWPGASRLRGSLAILLTLSLALITTTDADCLRSQPEARGCAPAVTSPQTGDQAGTCTYCADRLPVCLAFVLPVAPKITVVFPPPTARAFHASHLDRPPISA